MKLLVSVLLLFIIGSLFSGLFFLVKDEGKSARTAKALTYRVVFSGVLILTIVILVLSGQITLNPTPL